MRTKNNFRKNPMFQNCPQCLKSNTLRKSHPRNWKEALADNLTFFKMYRCRECGWRGHLSTYNSSALSAKLILFYASVVIVVSYIVLTVLSKLVH
ncbi:MAG: hypothetical protein P4L45_09000 [Ignavibacteriaceae bacterium]|nr:hypothetical protein [Ignavibacteriaceae bacterium]